MSLCKQQSTRLSHPSARGHPTVAILYQALEPPIINGARKPRKPGGYQDSGADIAHMLRKHGVHVLTPSTSPDPSVQEGWCFPDTEEGISSAVKQGATHLWANTVLFSSHPLQVAESLAATDSLFIIGQPPALVEDFDDKAYLNEQLRKHGSFTLPQSWVIHTTDEVASVLGSIHRFPVIAKPVRGRGSHGVKLCHDSAELEAHVEILVQESSVMVIEEFLTGEEVTITVMPPSAGHETHWSLPPVTRFNHVDGVAPYCGAVAVTANSRVVTADEMQDASYGSVMRQCEQVASLIGATAPVRIDTRRFREGSEFAIFDINMKPNMTGPGRPGREDQASLCVLAAAAIGWDYGTLLQHILEGAVSLVRFRNYQNPFLWS
ncbi:glutathione synthetase ATP-binding domain-like protein [Aspergillus saccharolyticus JOP 1030-1]|uniref:Glutathione synthetase ATP-binding domain-like protein n=1 Tax=Aspergillus saccharolyticus JOP 1030-1 TaxID=1450539 RepID=A0A319ADB9_9EURO|nr:glutathione synthetase ATP-binding domain-like protein [Aspergillus saccharolyticus JOP 1030-1]PYH49578.1 glutathione synthetase ATP-binding domain-like protein [Aspergillus saccharolyticus JOP 1030-1]